MKVVKRYKLPVISPREVMTYRMLVFVVVVVVCLIFILFIYFLAVLGLRCCTRAFSSCGEQGLLFVSVRGLLTAVASLVAEHRL